MNKITSYSKGDTHIELIEYTDVEGQLAYKVNYQTKQPGNMNFSLNFQTKDAAFDQFNSFVDFDEIHSKTANNTNETAWSPYQIKQED